jgi:hypothetical protein
MTAAITLKSGVCQTDPLLQVWEDPFSLRDVESGGCAVAFSKRRVLEFPSCSMKRA